MGYRSLLFSSLSIRARVFLQEVEFLRKGERRMCGMPSISVCARSTRIRSNLRHHLGPLRCTYTAIFCAL